MSPRENTAREVASNLWFLTRGDDSGEKFSPPSPPASFSPHFATWRWYTPPSARKNDFPRRLSNGAASWFASVFPANISQNNVFETTENYDVPLARSFAIFFVGARIIIGVAARNRRSAVCLMIDEITRRGTFISSRYGELFESLFHVTTRQPAENLLR